MTRSEAGEKQVLEMISRRLFVTVSLMLTTTLLSIPYSSAAGRSTSAVVNTILNGKGVPKSSLGIDGDFYIDTRSLLLYGPKLKGKWPTPQSIQGPTGPAGNDGRNGSDGKTTATNVSAVAGPQGPQGAVGPQGEKGEKGDPGTPGAMGPAGAAGANGSVGPAGPSGANGSNGAQGPAGTAGTTGATGAQGAKGETGTAGAQGLKGETGTVGPSEVTVIDIPTISLATSVPYSYATSNAFGSLDAGKNYSFEIFLRATSSLIDLVLGADLISTGSTLKFNYVRTDFRAATYSAVQAIYGFHLSGTIEVGATNSNLSVRIIDGRGETGASALNLTGKAYITLVGAIK